VRHSLLLSGVAALLLPLGAATAADYPTQSMEWVVPAPAGGGTDTAARRLATLVEAELGQPIAVVNIAGGGGSVGITQFLQIEPDGYTLLAVWNGAITTIPNVQPVQYDTSSYRPIVSTSETAYVFCVEPDFPADSGEEFLQVLAENPDRYTYGNDGVGGTMQLAAERIFGEFGASAVPVPFGGAGETLQNFLGGHVDIYGGSISPVLPYVESGEAKCLLVTTARGVEALPDAASLEDLGRPELEIALWRAILGPASMPDEQADVIADAVEKAMADEDYLAFLAGLGEWPAVYRGEALRERIENEYNALGEVATSLGLKD